MATTIDPTTLTQWVRPTPRDYQEEAATTFLNGTGNGIALLATGLGKTLCCSYIFRSHGGRCVFLAHTGELVRQTCRAMLKMGLWPSVEMADEYHGDPYIPTADERRDLFPNGFPPNEWFTFGQVVVATMQTFVSRIEKYREGGFDLACFDEAHRSLARTWLKIWDGLLGHNPKTRLLGLTATPMRGDKRNLSRLFPGEEVNGVLMPKFVCEYDTVWGIENGYLVDVICESGTLKADASQWEMSQTSHGRDVSRQSLSKSMSNAECIESIAHEVIEKGGQRQGIIFLPGIAVTESVTAALNAIEPGCATFIHGKVPKKERRRRVRKVETGKYRYVCGCDALIEGFDVPAISMVVMARPTGQMGRYIQMLGRGLRVLANCIKNCTTGAERRKAVAASAKSNCLVLDYANNSRFKLVSARDVLMRDAADKKKAEYVRKNTTTDDKRKVRDQLDELEALYDLQEALRSKGGPPPKMAYEYRHVNLFGSGGTTKAGSAGTKARRPTTEQIRKAHDLMIEPEKAEKMTAQELECVLARQKDRIVGRKTYGFLMGQGIDPKQHRLNWHDGQYLRRLVMSSGRLPANWKDLVDKNRVERLKGRATDER